MRLVSFATQATENDFRQMVLLGNNCVVFTTLARITNLNECNKIFYHIFCLERISIHKKSGMNPEVGHL